MEKLKAPKLKIGNKVKFFKEFKDDPNGILYLPVMDDYIGSVGTLTIRQHSYDRGKNECWSVRFPDGIEWYIYESCLKKVKEPKMSSPKTIDDVDLCIKILKKLRKELKAKK